MTSKSKHFVIGGNSQVARALKTLDFGHCDYVVRRAADGETAIEVPDYAAVSADMLAGYESVINCVGVTSGPQDLMQRLNVECALSLAQAARDAGVRRFVHISSFSVYGRARAISSVTEEAPTSEYGRSKLAGDRALAALESASFKPIMLRLPLIYAPGNWGKLGQLIAAWRKVGFFPVPNGDVARSMISTTLTAQVLAQLAQSDLSGVVHAADATPFSYALVQKAREERLRAISVPRWAADGLIKLAPELGARLFENSLLMLEDNMAERFELRSQLANDIRTTSF